MSNRRIGVSWKRGNIYLSTTTRCGRDVRGNGSWRANEIWEYRISDGAYSWHAHWILKKKNISCLTLFCVDERKDEYIADKRIWKIISQKNQWNVLYDYLRYVRIYIPTISNSNNACEFITTEPGPIYAFPSLLQKQCRSLMVYLFRYTLCSIYRLCKQIVCYCSATMQYRSSIHRHSCCINQCQFDVIDDKFFFKFFNLYL